MNLPGLEALARAVDQCAADGLQGQKKQRNVAVSRSSGTEGDKTGIFFERETFERLAATRRSSATVWFQHVHAAALSLSPSNISQSSCEPTTGSFLETQKCNLF